MDLFLRALLESLHCVFAKLSVIKCSQPSHKIPTVINFSLSAYCFVKKEEGDLRSKRMGKEISGRSGFRALVKREEMKGFPSFFLLYKRSRPRMPATGARKEGGRTR